MTHNNNNKNSKKAKMGKRNPKYVRTMKKALKNQSNISLGEARLLRLLRDPCNADFTEPAYSGGGTGLFYRTRNIIYPPSLLGQSDVGHFILQVSPGNINTAGNASNYYITSGFSVTNTSFPVAADTSVTNIINQSSGPVYSSRPVAGCVRWIPNGRYGIRSGTIGLCSWENTPVLTATQDSNKWMEGSLHMSSNGDEKHEVIFIPTEYDGSFNRVSGHSFDPRCGAYGIIGQGIDTRHEIVDGITYSRINGYFEVVTVWEWEANSGNGLTNVRKSPPKTTLNDLLSKVEDLSSFALTGAVRTASKALIPTPIVKAVHGVSNILHGMESLLR